MISVARAKDSAKTQEANKRSKRERERYVHRADRRLSRSRRSRLAIEIAISPIAIDRDHNRADRDRDLPIAISPFVRIWWFFSGFWVLFVFWGMNDIMYSFGNRENVSNKYKMCFLRYFQEHNQTSENIFRNIFWNATKHMKIFSFSENSISRKISIFRKYFYTNQTQPYIGTWVSNTTLYSLTFSFEI